MPGSDLLRLQEQVRPQFVQTTLCRGDSPSRMPFIDTLARTEQLYDIDQERL